ncbi:MAG: 30S ribosomal protein S21 [Candidatus Harrisonbacteria bacterium]|nr:30S ribosomal protein S21 [Candidatus Harrisonbacteria bacterium]
MQVRKKDGENISSLLYRFSKKIQQSGILKEAKKRRFYKRSQNRNKLRLAAKYRAEKVKETERAKKLGLL